MLPTIAAVALASSIASALPARSAHMPLSGAPQGAPAIAEADPPLPRRAGPMGVRLESPTGGAVEVTAVVPGSPAARTGIEAGMRLVEVNGTPIASREDVQAAMRTVMAGSTVQVKAQRGDEAPRTFAVAMEAASEAVPGSVVRYGSVRVPAGYRLRTIVTEPEASPLAVNGKMPALMYVQGIICQSVDNPLMPDLADTRIMHAVAGAGFVTMRVDKPGVGDSEGPPCSEIDLQGSLPR